MQQWRVAIALLVAATAAQELDASGASVDQSWSRVLKSAECSHVATDPELSKLALTLRATQWGVGSFAASDPVLNEAHPRIRFYLTPLSYRTPEEDMDAIERFWSLLPQYIVEVTGLVELKTPARPQYFQFYEIEGLRVSDIVLSSPLCSYEAPPALSVSLVHAHTGRAEADCQILLDQATPELDRLESHFKRDAIPANPLQRIWWRKFRRGSGALIQKPLEYLDTYHRFFDAFRQEKHRRPVRILEIGVQSGGSIEMWQEYFGENAQIIGVDIEPECASLASPSVEIIIGNQGDPAFVDSLVRRVKERFGTDGTLDVIIDDGSHIPEHQVLCFNRLYELLQPDGVYVCEDLEPNYPINGQLGEFARLAMDLTKRLQERQVRAVGPTAIGSVSFLSGQIVVQKRQMLTRNYELAAGNFRSRIQERCVGGECVV